MILFIHSNLSSQDFIEKATCFLISCSLKIRILSVGDSADKFISFSRGFSIMESLLNQSVQNQKVVCAWCGITMQEGPGPDISHGICQSCYSSVLSVRSTSLKDFIEKLPVPVMAVNDLGRAAFSNSKAQAMVGKDAELIQNELGGDIFECIHSKKSGGCGKTIH